MFYTHLAPKFLLMKTINRVITAVLFALIAISCTQENDVIEETALLVHNHSNLKEQSPNPTLDTSSYGLYHGVVASASSLSRGQIWINVANNSRYVAYIELVGGTRFSLDLDPSSIPTSANIPQIYEFEGVDGHFILDLSDQNTPEISEITLSNETYFGRVVKSLSSNRASIVTATFSEIGNPDFSGTFNLIADGTIVDPNGNNGEGITSLLITMDGDAYEDFDFEMFNATTCLGVSSYYPTLSSFGVADFIVSDYQTFSFAGGMAKWNMSYDPTGTGYMNYFLCDTATTGTFTWTSADGTQYRVGEIVMD